MKLIKYPQSCLFVESEGTCLLIDPGKLCFDEKFLKIWKKADAIFVTHKHGDHFYPDAVKNLTNIPIFSTQEVAKSYQSFDFNIVKENQTIKVKNLKIEVVKAIHGYNPRLKNNGEVFENVGYIVDDGKIRLYVTSDTICFKNDYKADVVFAPVTGYGLTMNAFETALFTQETGAKLLIVSHLDNPVYPRDVETIEKELSSLDCNFVIPEIEQKLEI